MALTDKTVANTYKDLLQLDNSNSGRTANGTTVKDGLGNSTALTLGSNKIAIKPAADNTAALTVEKLDGTDLLVVDTSNSLIKAGTTQTYVGTQIQRFTCHDLQPTADTHHSMYVDGAWAAGFITLTFGTSTDPATTYSLSASEANAFALVLSSWYIPAAITIDEVRVIAGGEASDTLNFHLFSYDMATGTGSNAGDLSNGVVVASTGSTLTIGNDRVTSTTLTRDNPDVAADKVIIATVENVGATTDVTAQLIVKYHYQ